MEKVQYRRARTSGDTLRRLWGHFGMLQTKGTSSQDPRALEVPRVASALAWQRNREASGSPGGRAKG